MTRATVSTTTGRLSGLENAGSLEFAVFGSPTR
jgi:hypothetical protein